MLLRHVCIASALGIALTACSHESPTPLIPAASSATISRTAAPEATTIHPVYSFGKIANDGSAPQSAPVAFDGAIFGTTTNGGNEGFGTIFSVTPKGVEKIWHSFKQTDGSQPGGNMIVHGKVLYGTTYVGGKFSFGTAFKISRSGKYGILHSFADDAADGGFLQGGLVAFDSKLYGTTEGGGANGAGTLFSVTSTGHEVLLHSFATAEGSSPGSSLIVVNGALYGTTFSGGKFGRGTAFRATADGQIKVLHNFGSGTDGATPFSGFTNLNGTLYGTTGTGGEHGLGAVYKLTLGGKETVLYSFPGATDGCTPFAGLTLFKGMLYGTTFGSSSCGSSGTVFRITPAGSETTLHSFSGGTGGGNPYGGLGAVGTKLYGTTQNGGFHNQGMVFSFTP